MTIAMSMRRDLVLEQMLKSQFCLQADGNAPWTPRLAEYMTVGCVPVFISDRFIPPFQRVLDWTNLSVHISPSLIGTLKPKLNELVATGRWEELRANVLRVRDAFLYDLDDGSRGAFPLITYEMTAALAGSQQ
eukprot:gnl/TRDRNA2_/TRDRNA2_157699_c0_seq2.p1 gnl/TRDRNA2_/TRDRNA2_157699_c0~~gnl/TRDRNA2_/TRDRNA2_157699_c0_seq2.p1  ORF type:complete len:133 (+),score=14.81 gnl/TRDRNA2_/TRDRNA2_157699_c0_seq2:52-450(+)